ncbi:DUF1801 domain-containing protein [Nocardiopsis alkaliphila]|uniref:DUF1801 domain-containing protein n=1 Tax=Nocardiopsis alkaliphila TaxID=225762 RepID=UPI0003606AD1|nr:DUF1801 domain-containing protein [Nocardiopsis alkaliphila]
MSGENTSGFFETERTAMKERAAELKKEAGRGGRGDKAAREERDLLAKIEAMEPADRALAERVHALVTATAPDLKPKLWYGQPAYARKDKVVCFFRSGHDDKERYSTFGFTPEAGLDDHGGLWATSFAVRELSEEAEKTIVSLLERAVA